MILISLFLFVSSFGTNLLIDDGCWKSAQNYIIVSENLNYNSTKFEPSSNCKEYSDKKKSVISLLIAECHLTKRTLNPGCLHKAISNELIATKDVLPRPETYEANISECLSKLTEYEFTTYTQFYSHIESICFLIHADLWQKKAESLMLELHDNSYEVNQQLKIAYNNNMKLIEQQSLSMDSQKHILALSNYISNSIQSSNEKLDDAFESIQQRLIKEHNNLKHMLDDMYLIINNVNKIQQYFRNKYLNIESVLLYLILLYLTKLFTSEMRTQNCKNKLMLWWLLSYFVEVYMRNDIAEKLVSKLLVADRGFYLHVKVLFPQLQFNSSYIITSFRIISLSIAIMIWLRSYKKYIDPHTAELYSLKNDIYMLSRKLDFILQHTYKSNRMNVINHSNNFSNDKRQYETNVGRFHQRVEHSDKENINSDDSPIIKKYKHVIDA